MGRCHVVDGHRAECHHDVCRHDAGEGKSDAAAPGQNGDDGGNDMDDRISTDSVKTHSPVRFGQYKPH